MPSSNAVDERVVQMRMDNEQFEKGAERTIGTLEKLKKSMDFKDASSDMGKGFTALEQSVEKIGDKISMTFSAKKRVIENMIDGVVNSFKHAVNELDNISPGFKKYESQIEAVQKLMIATGESMENVQKMSDKILAFTDETSYDYSAMLSTLSQFSTAGVGLEDAQNTIIGLAVAAGQAGVSTNDATHAFMGFQKAISQGYMGSNQWDWIKTAGMNTIELQQALINAAVAEGKLRDAGNGLYYAQQQTAKGVKEIEVTVENIGNTFASKWLSKDAIIRGVSNYAKAFNQIYDIKDQTDLAIWQIIDEDSPYLDQLDQYSLAAFRAGQETKTWSDAVNALKSTISSGWMKSFELLIGNYKQASGFFTDIIEPLYTIFTGSGAKRNQFLEAAFGGGETKKASDNIGKASVNWDKLAKKLTAAEHTTDELEEAFRKVAESDDKVRALTGEYGSLEEAIKDGAVSADLLKRILDEINGVTTETTEAMADNAASYQQYLETAWAVLRGDFGNGEERRKALEELGMDYEMIQWLAGNLANGMTMDTLTLDWIAQVAPNHYQHFIEILGQTGAAAEAAGKEFIDLKDVVEEASVVSETAGLSGREIWQNSITNILTSFADALTAVGDAFDEVFGDAKTRGEGFRGWLNRIYEATKHFEISEDLIESIHKTAVSFFIGVQKYGGSALDFLGKRIRSIIKHFGTVKKAFGMVTGLFGDLLRWVRKIFSGKLSLPENMQNAEGLLGRIGVTLSNIIQNVSNFLQTADPWAGLDLILDKIGEIRDYFKGGGSIGELIRNAFKIGDGGESKGILGFFSRLFGGFKKDSDEMSDGLLTIEDSVDGFSDSIRGLDSTLTKVGGILEPVSNLLFGDPAELEKKLSGLWGSVKKIFVTEYGKINWDTLLDVGKLGLIGFLISKTGGFFSTLQGTLKNGNNKLGTFRGLIASLQGISDSIQAPFKAMSKAITNSEKADRYLKIAAAIGILAWSIAKLTEVDEQKFFNVAVTLGLLMMIMARMAKNMDGFQLFSNNVKQISKNNQNTSSVLEHLGESLKNLLSIDLSNFQGKLKINVFSQVAQTLVGAAILLTAIVHALIKLKDITQPGELEKLYPAFIVIGSILAAMTAMVSTMAAFTSKSKYLGKSSWVMLAMTASLLLIIRAIKSLSDTIKVTGYAPVVTALAAIVAIMAMTGLVLLAAGTMVRQGGVLVSGGGSIIAVAGVMIAIGILVRSIAKTIDMASKFTNLTQGILIVVGILVAIVVMLGIMSLIVKSPAVTGGKMAGVAASLLILAVAIAALAVPIGILSSMNLKPEALLASAAALGILVLAAAGAMLMLSGVPSKKLLVVAAVLGIVAVVLGLLMSAAALFATTMISLVTQIPWEELNDRVKAFDEVLRPELGLLLGIGAAAMMFGIGCAGAAVAAGVFGLSFLAIAAGIYIVAAALPKLIDGIIYFVQRLNEHGWEIVEFVGLILGAILAVMVAKKLEFGKAVVNIVSGIVTALQDGVLIGKVLGVIAMFAEKALAMLIVLAPIFSEKLVNLIVKLVWSVAEALNAKSNQLIAAFEALIGSLFTIAVKALVNLSGDMWTFLISFFGEMIVGLIRGFPGGDALADKVMGWVEQAAEGLQGGSNYLSDAADRALERSFMNSKYKPDIETDDANVTIPNADVAVESARWRPGQEANIVYDGTVPVNVGVQNAEVTPENVSIAEDVGPEIAELVVESADGAVDGESFWGSLLPKDGMQAYVGDAFGDFGSMIPTEQMQSSIDSVLGEGGVLDTSKGVGEDNALGFLGTFGNTITGSDGTSTMEGGALSCFNIFGNKFNSSSEEGTPILGNNLIVGLYNSLMSRAKDLLPAAGRYSYDQYDSGLREAGDIDSPSKEMAKDGMWMILGLAKGIYDNADIAYGAGADTATGLLNEFRDTMERVALIASDDLTVAPTITPVVDLANVQTAAGLMNGALGGNYSMTADMTASVSRRMNDAERVASEMNAREQAITESGDIYTFNIYASPGMDENMLADAVLSRMQTRLARRDAAFGT